MPLFFRFVIAAFAKIFSKLFSLTTVSILGRVPSRDDSKISFIGVLSLYWLFVLISLISPSLDNIAIPFLPNNAVVIEISGILLLIVIPLVVGWIMTKLQNYDPKKTSLQEQLAMAYPYTALLGFVIIALIIAIPIIKAPLILKRYKVENLKVMIDKGNYGEALDHIESILKKHDMRTKKREPHQVMSALLLVLAWVMESAFKRKISKQITIIEGRNRRLPFQITVHATDISIAAKREEKSELMAILSEELDGSYLYFSWDDASQKVEDQIRELRDALRNDGPVRQSDISGLSVTLRTLGLSREEWNSIRSQIYKLECEYFKTMQYRSMAATYQKGS